jgi:hypothetical protein
LDSLTSSDKLAEIRQVTFILRLSINRNGQVLHGEVVDVSDKSQRRVKSLAELPQILGEWLSNLAWNNPPNQNG